MGAAPSRTHRTQHLVGGKAEPSSAAGDEVKVAPSNGRLSPAAEGGIDTQKTIQRPPPPPAAVVVKVEEGGNEPVVPHNYHTIMAEADEVRPDHGLRPADIYTSGAYLNNHTKGLQKYWVDTETGCNCFLFFAGALSITWSEDPRFWSWCSVKGRTSDQVEVEVQAAALRKVCWLEVHGWIGVANLTPGATYEVVFLVRMDEPAYGWQVPVLLRLVAGAQQQRRERLVDLPRGRWVELLVGSFRAAPDAGEVVQFSMFEYEGGLWKSGLVVIGAVIRPKRRPTASE